MTTTSYDWMPLSEASGLSADTAGFQAAVALATNAAGTGYFAAWTHVDEGGYQLRGRLFGSDGVPATGDLPLGLSTPVLRAVEGATGLTDGRFVVTFIEEGVTPDARAVIVAADGSPLASLDVAVGAHDEVSPDVTALKDGGYAFSWTRDLGGGNQDIYVSVYNADGTLRHAPIAAIAGPADSRNSSIAGLAGGGFVVAWQHDFDVRFRRFDASGVPLGADSGVSIDANGANRDIQIAGLPDGGFVVAYEDTSWGSGSDISMRTYNANGSPRSAVLLANAPANGAATAGEQDKPLLAAGPEGYYVVGWRSDSVQWIQAYASAGGAVGQSTPIALNVFNSELTVLNGGVLAAAWDRVSTIDVDASVHETALVLRRFIKGDDGNETINGINNPIREVIHGRGGNDTINAGVGDDTIHGGPGLDTIDGGAGDDTAVFGQSAANYRVQDFGSLIVVTGAEGLGYLSGIEHLQFADGTMNVTNDGNALFDALYYLSRNPDVFHAGVDPLAHFNSFGWQEGRDPNALFDVSGYLAVNPDVAAGGMNPLDHYRQTGWHEGRDPSANFDTTLYLLRNPDVAGAGVDPLAHYLAFGAAEGRQAYKAVGTIVSGFDAQYYLFHNPDVAAAGVDPRTHFNLFGWHEGRKANGWFDTAGYLTHYTDVAAAGVNPLEHYAQFGWKEGRDPSAGFDTLGYLAANPDVAAANIDPLEHYLMFGIYEGRQMVNDGIWH